MRRVSSATAPSLSGTLRSSRTTTRFPRRLPASRKPLKRIELLGYARERLRENHLGHVGEPARVAPLVVVPGGDLDEVAVGVGQPGVDDRAVGRALEVARDELFFAEEHDVFERAAGRIAQESVDFVLRRLALDLRD